MNISRKPLFGTTSLALAIAFAQGANAATLEEIVVTAQKRAENLQDVPISVSALNGEKITDAGIQRFDEMSAYIPNFQVSQDAIGDRINIRGLESGTQAGFEQSVATFVDGIYRGRSVQTRFSFLDVGMVEVLRGPQGTLFGKNTIAGAMNIRSAKPTETFEGAISGSYNVTFNAIETSGHLAGPLSDSVRGRIAFLSRDMDQGWMENELRRSDDPQTDEWAARGSLEWDIGDNTVLYTKFEHGEWDNSGLPYEIVVAGGLSALGVEEQQNFKSQFSDINIATGLPDPVQDFGSVQIFSGETDEFGLNLEHSFDGGETLTIIGGYSAYEFERFFDADLQPLSLIRFDDTEELDQTTLEIRIASDGGANFEYVAGAFYMDADLTVDGLVNFNLPVIAGLTTAGCMGNGGVVGGVGNNLGTSAATASNCALAAQAGPLAQALPGVSRYALLEQKTRSWALFGQGTWNLGDDLRLTLGLRYTEENKEGRQTVHASDYASRETAITSNPLVAGVSQVLGEFTTHDFDDLSRDEQSLTWSANLQWDINADTMAYATASSGFKAGGFNSFYMGATAGGGANQDDVEFEEERALAFEIGAKMTLLDGAAELNLALFRTDYQDLQVSVFSGNTTFEVDNAAEATTQGIEIDGRWQASENLMLTGGFGWTDFEFDRFANQACTNAQFIAYREAAWNSGGNPAAAGLNNASCAADGVNDMSGRSNANTPEFSATLSANYSMAVGSDYELGLVLDAIYTDSTYRQADLDAILETDAMVQLNAVVRFGALDGQWDISLVGKNLTDEDQYFFGNDVPLANGSHVAAIMQPRNLALRASYRF